MNERKGREEEPWEGNVGGAMNGTRVRKRKRLGTWERAENNQGEMNGRTGGEGEGE